MAARDFAGIDLNNLRAPDDATTTWGRLGRLRFKTLLDLFTNDPDWSRFLMSEVRYEEGSNDDWVPGKPLGKGSFGKVALWSKKNDLSEIVDNVAVKQRKLVHHPLIADGVWRNHLAKEAFIQSQLTSNDQDDCIVPLKGYKYYHHLQQCRLYMGYAPHGSLEAIRTRYRAFDRFLPELWLWCVFENLVEACLLMRNCPAQWQPMSNQARDQPRPFKFIVHCDIKPSNIFVYERQPMHDPSKKLPKLPRVKLGDFGLAQVTSPTDANNPDMLHSGTDGYKPPEVQTDGAGRLFDALWQNRVHTPNQRFIEQHNIWCIGKIMHDLALLQPPGVCQDELFSLPEGDYYTFGHPRFRHFTEPFVTQTHPGRLVEYSQNLRNLIRICLRPYMYRRPMSQNLLADIRLFKQNCIDDVKLHNQGRGPRKSDHVNLTTAEMNALVYRPEANFSTGLTQQHQITIGGWQEWEALRNGDYLDPDEPLFTPPRAKWAPFYQREDARNAAQPKKMHDLKGARWKQAGHKVHFRPNLEELSAAEIRKEERKGPKRMRSWDENTERNAVVRQKLLTLRSRVPYANRQPLAIFEIVLENAGQVVGDAEEVLCWFYRPNLRAPDWAWLKEPRLEAKARKVKQRLDAKGLRRSLKECKYFVRHSAYGVEQVDHAVEQMLAIFTK